MRPRKSGGRHVGRALYLEGTDHDFMTSPESGSAETAAATLAWNDFVAFFNEALRSRHVAIARNAKQSKATERSLTDASVLFADSLSHQRRR